MTTDAVTGVVDTFVRNEVHPTKETLETVIDDEAAQPPCYARHNTMDLGNFLIPATLLLKRSDCPINVLIDTGCLQTNTVSTRIAALPRQDGDTMSALRSASLTSREDDRTGLRVLVCDDVKTDNYWFTIYRNL